MHSSNTLMKHNVNDAEGINASLAMKTKEVMREANTEETSDFQGNREIVQGGSIMFKRLSLTVLLIALLPLAAL